MTPEEVRAFAPLVKACARRCTPAMLPASIDADDLESVCWQALVLAERSFDPTRGTLFSAWAWRKMRGAVLDEIRSQRYGKRDGEWAEPSEVSEHDAQHGPSLEERAQTNLDLAEVVEAVKALPERERTVLVGKLNGKTGADVAADLGVTESRVSQLNSGAIGRLRKQVAA